MPATVPSDPIVSRLAPKRGGGFRRMAELSRRDAASWGALAGRVAVALEPRLSPLVLANRAHIGPDGWRPVPLGPALATARRRARDLARTARYVVRTDVRAFYPSVTPDVLHGILARLCPREARSAAAMLEEWGSEGYAGLPIGPPGSAVLANGVLAGVDGVLKVGPFLRWVDDYLIAAPTERAAAEILEQIDQELERVGLRRSAAKTRISEGAGSLTWPGGASMEA